MKYKVDQQEVMRHFSLLGYQPDDAVYIRCFPSVRSDNQKGENWRDIYPELDFSQLQTFADQGLGLYLVVNGQGHRDAEIAAGRAIFCEHDNLSKEEQLVLWRKVGLPEPTFQVDTGGKSIHSYWVFNELIPCSMWRKLQTDLLEFVDGDRKIKNPSRVMRLAGGCHQSGHMTKIVSAAGSRYNYEDLREVVPVSKASVFAEPGATWHTWVESVKFPIDDVVPIEVALTRENRSLLETGTFDYRNDNGFALATNLIATANYLSSIGQAYDGNPEQLFMDYCRKCPSRDGWNEREWESIWKSAQRGDKHTSLAPDQIENCIKAWLWRKVKPTLETQAPQQQASNSNHPEVDPDEADEQLENQRELLEEFARYKQDKLDLKRVYPEELAIALTRQALSLPIAPEALHQFFLSVASGIIGTRARLRIRLGWHEPCVFFTGFVGEPGTKKSPALKVVRSPLVELQKMARESYQAKQEEFESQKRQWDAKKKEERAEASADEVPKEPNMRHYYMEDFTIEAVIAAHAQEESSTGFSILLDEMAEMFNGLNQYKAGGKGNDREKLLRLWNGGDLKSDRKGVKAGAFVPKSSVSITGGIQPHTLERLVSDPNDGDGLWGRFLWSYPQYIRADHRGPAVDISAYLGHIYQQLDSFPEDRVFTLSGAAEKLFYQFESWVEDERTKSSPAMQNALSKMVGYLGRLSLFLHCIDIATDASEDIDVIPEETMQRALYLCQYYLNQVKIIHTKTVEKNLPESLTRIIGLSQEIGKVSDRVLVQKHWVSSAKEAREVFSKLTEMGLGVTHSEGRVSKSWEVLKKDPSLVKSVEPTLTTPKPGDSKDSNGFVEVLNQNCTAKNSEPVEPPRSDLQPEEQVNLQNNSNGLNTFTKKDQSHSGKGFAPKNNGSTNLTKTHQTVEATTNGSGDGLGDLPEIDLRDYGINPDEWEEY